MKLYWIWSIAVMSCPFLNATIIGPERPYFHPYFTNDSFTGSPVKVKSKTWEITTYQYFVDIQITWALESKSPQDIPFTARIPVPPGILVDKFGWPVNGDMVDASSTSADHAENVFAIASMNSKPVASVTGEKGVYTISGFPISESNPQTISMSCLLPVPANDQYNFLELALNLEKGVPTKITVHHDNASPILLSGGALENFNKVETDSGFTLSEVGSEKTWPIIKKIRMAWLARPEPSLLIGKKEKGGWLYAIRTPMPALPLTYNKWTPKFSDEVVVFWSPPTNRDSHHFKDRMLAFRKLYWHTNRIQVVFIDGGMAKPLLAKSGWDERDFDAVSARLEAFEASDFNWKMPDDYMTNKHLCLLVESDHWPTFLPKVPEDVGMFFYPRATFPGMELPFFNASVVWDYRNFKFVSGSRFFVIKDGFYSSQKNYFENNLLVPSFSLDHPKVQLRSGPTELHIFGLYPTISNRNNHQEVPRQLLITGQVRSLPERFQFSFPWTGLSWTLNRESAQEIPSTVLERWIFQSKIVGPTKVNTLMKSGTPDKIYLRSLARKKGFLVFKDLESYRTSYVLPADNFPADEVALRQLESDSVRWPDNFLRMGRDILRSKENNGMVKFVPMLNGKPLTHNAIDIFFATGVRTTIQTGFKGGYLPINVKAGTYDIVARLNGIPLVKIREVEVIAGETTEVPLAFKFE